MKKIQEIDEILNQLHKDAAPYNMRIASLNAERQRLVKRMKKMSLGTRWHLFKMRIACDIAYNIAHKLFFNHEPMMIKVRDYTLEAGDLLMKASLKIREYVSIKNNQEYLPNENEEIIDMLKNEGWTEDANKFMIHDLCNNSKISISIPEPDEDDMCIMFVGYPVHWEPLMMETFKDAVKIARMILSSAQNFEQYEQSDNKENTNSGSEEDKDLDWN